MTPGMTGRPGKWPWKNHSVAVTALMPTMRFSAGSYSTMRSTRRNGQRCGIRPSMTEVESGAAIDGVAPSGVAAGAVSMVASVTAGSMRGRDQCAAGPPQTARRSLQACTTRGSRACLRGEEGGAADAVEEVRREPALEERLGGEQRAVDLDVRDHALDD